MFCIVCKQTYPVKVKVIIQEFKFKLLRSQFHCASFKQRHNSFLNFMPSSFHKSNLLSYSL